MTLSGLNEALIAIVIVLLALLAYALMRRDAAERFGVVPRSVEGEGPLLPLDGEAVPYASGVRLQDLPLYTSAAVDPLVTGKLYEARGNMRDIYLQRTAFGLSEYAPDTSPGLVGVDIGPYGLAEYGGRRLGTDDGMPWGLPETPVRWYRVPKQDNYGPEGPTPYVDNMYALTEPDHDPLV